MTDNPFISEADAPDADNPFLATAEKPKPVSLMDRMRIDAGGSFHGASGAGTGGMAARQGILENAPIPRIEPNPDDPDSMWAAKIQRANRPSVASETAQYDAIQQGQEDAKASLAQYEALRPAKGIAENTAAVFGHIGGSIVSPESWIMEVPGVSTLIGNFVKAGWLARTGNVAASQALIQAAVNPAIQGANIKTGMQEHFEPGQIPMAAAQGAAIGILAHNLLHEGPRALWGAPEPVAATKPGEAPKTTQEGQAATPAAEAAPEGVKPVGEAMTQPEPTPPAQAAADDALGVKSPAETVLPEQAAPRASAREPAPPRDASADALIGAPAEMPPHRVTTANGTSVDVAPVVVDAANLRTSGDAGYDAQLQPRDRDRAASASQIADISSRLDPERLGYSSEADRGAPIVGPDGMVESGNGRIMAIRKAYEQGGDAASSYRSWVEKQGVDTSGMEQPILVRQRTSAMTPEQRQTFTVEANQSSTLALSAGERALADSRSLKPETLDLIRNPNDLNALDNRGFIKSFVQSLPQSEQGMMATAEGGLSSEGLARVRNAVLAKAYGDSSVLTRVAEATNDDVKSISNALVAAAPEWAKLRSDVESGLVRADMDLTPELMEAVTRTADIRGKGVKLDIYLAQQDAFNPISPIVQDWMAMFYHPSGRRAAGAPQIAERIKFYAAEARKVSAEEGLALDLKPVRPEDVQQLAASKGISDAAQNDLFKRGGSGDGPGNAGGGGEAGSAPTENAGQGSGGISNAGNQGRAGLGDAVSTEAGRAEQGQTVPNGKTAGVGEQYLRAGKQPIGPNADAARFANRSELPGEAIHAIGPNPAVTDAEMRGYKLNEAMRDIATRLGRKLETDGRFRADALGVYKPMEGVLRIRSVGDMEVFSHELGHAVDQILSTSDATKAAWNGLRSAQPSELLAMDLNAVRTGAAPSIEEGVAEFLRSFITNPAYANARAPLTFDAFRAILAMQPELRSILADAANLSRIESGMKPTQVLESMVVNKPEGGFARFAHAMRKDGLLPTLTEYSATVYQTLIGKDQAINRMVNALRDAKFEKTGTPEQNLTFRDDPYVLYRKLPGAQQAAIGAVRDGVRDYNNPYGAPVSISMEQAVRKAFGGGLAKIENEHDPQVKAFNGYLVARRARSEWARWEAGELRNQPIRASKNEVLQAVQQFETENPTFKEAADGVFEFQRAAFQRQVDAGIVSKGMADAVLARGSDHVPFWRDFEGEEARAGHGNGGGGQAQPLHMTFGGSTRDILSPLRSVIESNAIGERMIARNDVWKNLHRLAKDGGEFAGQFLEEIPNSEMRANSINIADAIRNNARAQGLSANDAEMAIRQLESTIGEDMSATVFKPHEVTPNGERVAFYWNGGERTALKVGDSEMAKNFFDLMTLSTAPEKDVFVKTMGAVNSAFQASITHAPRFLTGTLVRDNMTRIFIPRYMGWAGRVPGVQDLVGAYTMMFDRQFYKDYATGGGIRGGVYSHAVSELHAGDALAALTSGRNFVARTKEEFAAAPGPISKAKVIATTPAKMVTDMFRLIESSETISRVGVAKMTYKYLTKQGLSREEAMAGSTFEARDVLDYDRSGPGLTTVGRLAPFLRAGIQGADRSIRGVVGEPLMAAVRAYQRGGYANLDAGDKFILAGAWKNAIMGTGVAGGATALYHTYVSDTEAYQNASDYLKQTYYIIPMGHDAEGKQRVLTIHKPYDLPSVLINATENYMEGQKNNNPQAWHHFHEAWKEALPHQFHDFNSMLGAFAPIKYGYEVGTGMKLGFGERPPFPIVSDKLKALPPEMQYDAYSSEISKQIGAKTGWSPKMIDHFINSMTGTAGQDMSDIYSASVGDNPTKSLGEAMNRFWSGQVYRTQSGSPGVKADLQTLMARDHGSYARQAAAYKTLIEEGDREEADKIYNRSDDTTKTLMTLNSSAKFKPEDRALQPLVRSQQIASVVGSMMRQLGNSQIEVVDRSRKKGEEKAYIDLSPQEARAINTQMSQLVSEETRNGLAMVKQPGYENYPILDTSGRVDIIRSISADAGNEMARRLKAARVLPAQGVAAVWPEVQRRLLADRNTARLGDLRVRAMTAP